MREIKFRAWVKNCNYAGETGMSLIKYACFTGTSQPFDFVELDGLTGSFRLDDIEVMQFTGLHDKNGKEIYEGDIVRQNACYSERGSGDFSYDMTYIGTVRIEASKGVVIANITCTDNIDDNTFKVKHRKGLAGYRAEVIGNIYEHPDILKEGEKKP
jgi:uncharacterized phage protein (TIGR01671 family)